jgi:nucleoside transporter
MSPAIRLQLSVMMFLQYFVWGSWYVTMGPYITDNTGPLKFSDQQNGLAYGATALAAMISPFFVGMIADRFFASERVLAALHLVGAGLLWYLSTETRFGVFYPVLIVYTLCYMPTLALTNSLSFHHMEDPGRNFPGIRVLGTIGWIIAGYTLTLLGFGTNKGMFQLSAVASAALGVYCLTLPHTPPSKREGAIRARDVLGLDALALMKDRTFAVFVIGSFLVSIPLQFYYALTATFLTEAGMTNVESKMPFGQISEILFLLVMPFIFVRLGVKKMLLIGMLAWTARYLLFAYGNTGTLAWMLFTGIVLHGICYDFFFVTGQIYVDRRAPAAIRAAAQGFIAFATLGVGMFIGSWLSGLVANAYRTGPASHDWMHVWFVPAGMAAAVLILFAVLFKEQPGSEPAR